jgi:putative peptidoglycan lipid II flippase
MAGIIGWFSPQITQWQQMPFASQAWQLVMLLVIAIPVYFALLWLFGVRINQLKRQTIAETKS